ncbi:MAG: hypothetical protein ACQET0_10350, partial [Pseudomonadota bacterium]
LFVPQSWHKAELSVDHPLVGALIYDGWKQRHCKEDKGSSRVFSYLFLNPGTKPSYPSIIL